MPCIDNSLSIWDIAFRWERHNPNHLLYRASTFIPLEVKDTVRLLLHAIITEELHCDSLQERPHDPHPEMRAWREEQLKLAETVLDEGVYDRKFLKTHTVFRWEFARWCDRTGIPFPEFWFLPGWKTDEPGYPVSLTKTDPEIQVAVAPVEATERTEAPHPQIAKKQGEKAQDFAVRFASDVWSNKPLTKCADIARSLREDKQFRAFRKPVYSEKHIRSWIEHLDPRRAEKAKKQASGTRKLPESKFSSLSTLERNHLKNKK